MIPFVLSAVVGSHRLVRRGLHRHHPRDRLHHGRLSIEHRRKLAPAELGVDAGAGHAGAAQAELRDEADTARRAAEPAGDGLQGADVAREREVLRLLGGHEEPRVVVVELCLGRLRRLLEPGQRFVGLTDVEAAYFAACLEEPDLLVRAQQAEALRVALLHRLQQRASQPLQFAAQLQRLLQRDREAGGSARAR